MAKNIMTTMSPQLEMQQLINQCIFSNDFDTATQCLKIYTDSFGEDKFSQSCTISITPVTVFYIINDNEPEPDLSQVISTELHSNLSVIYLRATHLIEDFYSTLPSVQSKYFCFYDAGHTYEKNRIALLLSLLNKHPAANCIIHTRNYIDDKCAIISHPDVLYQKMLDGKYLDGKTLLTYSTINNRNLYGDLSTILLSTEYAQKLSFEVYDIPDILQPLTLIYQLLYSANITYTYLPLSSTIATNNNQINDVIADYLEFVSNFYDKNTFSKIKDSTIDFTTSEHFIPCKKEITFFYTDMGEYYNLKPIADTAENRGFTIKFTQNIHQSAEIGVYCQHICYPENSKFSIVLLHDMAQGHDRWPDFWGLERWDKFDMGIVPGKFWADMWSKAACQYYANPKCGTYQLGYPKSCLIHSKELSNRINDLKNKLHLKKQFSILYAPSWENDGKEDDFVKALAPLKNVNLLVKQAHWSDQYADIIQNIIEMRQLHEGKYDNLYYIEPEESIMTALGMCDLVVSDESSVMAEALMFDVPSIAVTDWLIPDTTPSRYASVPMNYVIKCKRAELSECVKQFISAPDKYNDVLQNGKLIFSNTEHCCNDIIDAIEYFTTPDSKASKNFLNKRLHSKYQICSMWN